MRQGDLFVIPQLDVISFLKTVPAVIGTAGLLTFLFRKRAPESDHDLVNIVNHVRNSFLLIGCAVLILLSVWLIYRPPPPDHDVALPLPAEFSGGGWLVEEAGARSDGPIFARDSFEPARGSLDLANAMTRLRRNLIRSFPEI